MSAGSNFTKRGQLPAVSQPIQRKLPVDNPVDNLWIAGSQVQCWRSMLARWRLLTSSAPSYPQMVTTCVKLKLLIRGWLRRPDRYLSTYQPPLLLVLFLYISCSFIVGVWKTVFVRSGVLLDILKVECLLINRSTDEI
jgi:hypothetical protein